MSYSSNVIYYYDGSFDGLMCCVFESFFAKEIPIAIEVFIEEEPTLFKVKHIKTDYEKSERVKKSIAEKISMEAKQMIEEVFLTNLEEKELRILYFMRLGYKRGASVCSMLTNDDVSKISKAIVHMKNEAHLMLGFVRFSDFNGNLLAVIHPKNNVLPIIAEHFCDRFSGENFMIFDKVHKIALVYENGVAQFMEIEDIELPPLEEEELFCRALWRKFYDTVAIQGRFNPKCRMSHMPKRYWKDMTEFGDDKQVG